MFDELKGTIELRRTFSAATGGRRLVVVSNRGPVEYQDGGDGQPRALRGAGGVVTALTALERLAPLTWLAAPVTEMDRRIALGLPAPATPAGRLLGNLRLRFVPLDPRVQELHYNVVSNPMLWFLHHGLWSELQRPDVWSELRHAWRHGYVPANAAFAHAVLSELRRPDTAPVVMFQDYQLYLAPEMVRRAAPASVLHHFIHVPWPAPEVWREFPWAFSAAICRGLLANDVVRFQTAVDAANFLRTCRELVHEADVDAESGVVWYQGRRTLVTATPVSVDLAQLRAAAASPEVQRYRRRLAAMAPGRVIVRVDRLDPAKNIVAGFQAFDRLLSRRPGLLDDVTFFAFLVPSRCGIREYDDYARQALALAEDINRRHAVAGRPRVRVFHEHNFEQALAGMTLYDVLLVNAKADGMNLVSKEGPIVNRRDGVLVLSTTAGSYCELRDAAIGVPPDDVEATAAALDQALTMPPAERERRLVALRATIARHDLLAWVQAQADDLARLLDEQAREEAGYAAAQALPPLTSSRR